METKAIKGRTICCCNSFFIFSPHSPRNSCIVGWPLTKFIFGGSVSDARPSARYKYQELERVPLLVVHTHNFDKGMPSSNLFPLELPRESLCLEIMKKKYRRLLTVLH